MVHNGSLTNYKELKDVLLSKGYTFESDTDTEVIAKLMTHIHKRNPNALFRSIVEAAVVVLDGAFAICVKSRFYPGEIVATKIGSPLLVGIKANHIVADTIKVQCR